MDLARSQTSVEALLNPRNVVLVGASDKPGSWAARTWFSLRKYGFPGAVYPVNPHRDALFGQTCYPDVASLPESPDHLVIVVPASAVAATLRAGVKAGARSATILASGFEEAKTVEGRALADELARVIAETGVAVSGPNCLGNVSARARLATLSQDGELTMEAGPVALVGQSGGVAIFVNRALQDRGLRAGYIISTGNETGLTTADYLAYFVSEPDVRVVVCYCEGIKDIGRFREACLALRAAGKSVVMFKSGQSDAGREAALAHTGSLAGSIEVFDALAADLGVIRVDSFDDAIEVTQLLAHARAPAGRRLAGLSLSGAYCGMLVDAGAKYNLSFPPLAGATVDQLKSLLSVGAGLGNPLDGGFGVLTSEDTYIACLTALESDPGVDALVVQEELPREPGADRRGERYLRRADAFVATRATKPVIFTTILSHGQSDYSRALRRELPNLAFLQEGGKSLRALDLVISRDERERLAGADGGPRGASASDVLIEATRARARTGAGAAVALDEVESKALLAAFGFVIPREEVARSASEAAHIAAKIGFPVALKAVSAELLHKSDVGAVQLNLTSRDDVIAAHHAIEANLAKAAFKGRLNGVLVSRFVTGGVELVLGLHHDPEVGPALIFGGGGVLLELAKDVAFAVPPMNERKAGALIARTRAGKLLAGYRGGVARDLTSVREAIRAMARVAEALGDVIESIDVNPLVAMTDGGGCLVLDALIILRDHAARAHTGSAL